MTDNALLKIAKELNKIYQEKKKALPYSLNIICELHDDENAHSRILRGLLQFNSKGKYPILQSFVRQVNELADCEADITIKNPKLSVEEQTTGRRRIDLLIKESKSYAIIIENKIWNAPDQEKQIEDYVNYVKELGIPKRKIYVIYLTYNGQKEISECSLTPKVQEILGYSKRNDGRFICMNFENDILPWLDNLMGTIVTQNESLLYSALVQYVDYLKTLFDKREEDIKIENELEEIFMEKLKTKSIEELLQIRGDVDKLQEIVKSASNNRIKELCEKKICKVIEKRGYKVKSFNFLYDNFLLEIEIPRWSKCWWAMEIEKGKLYSGIWCDVTKKVEKKHITSLKEVYDNITDKGYIGWDWFGDYELNDEFWINLESHSTKFVNSIVNELERVIEATKGMKL